MSSMKAPVPSTRGVVNDRLEILVVFRVVSTREGGDGLPNYASAYGRLQDGCRKPRQNGRVRRPFADILSQNKFAHGGLRTAKTWREKFFRTRLFA